MKIRWFDMTQARPIGTFVFNRPILIKPCSTLSPSQFLESLSNEHRFADSLRVERRELQLQATRRKQSLRKRGLIA